MKINIQLIFPFTSKLQLTEELTGRYFNGSCYALAFHSLGFTGLVWQLTAWSVVKTCFVVFVFPHCCLPLFQLEELFPLSAWKQAAGQQQVSLFLVVRSLGQPSFFSPCRPRVNHPPLSRSHLQFFKLIMGVSAFHTLSFLFNVFAYVIFSFFKYSYIWGSTLSLAWFHRHCNAAFVRDVPF